MGVSIIVAVMASTTFFALIRQADDQQRTALTY
jgi:hypothetical protein